MFQKPVIVGSQTADATAKLGELRAKAGELKIKLSDLDSRRVQLVEQGTQAATDEGRSALNRLLASVQHDLTTTQVQLEQINAQIDELQTERDMARAFGLQGPPTARVATTAPPPPAFDPALTRERERMIGAGAFIVLVPLVVALSRRLWHRGAPRVAVDIENSPRLQRIEQAIESIALEVERIGEAQRFTTKLLADRQPDAMARLTRKEPGTVTPH